MLVRRGARIGEIRPFRCVPAERIGKRIGKVAVGAKPAQQLTVGLDLTGGEPVPWRRASEAQGLDPSNVNLPEALGGVERGRGHPPRRRQ